MDRHIHLVGNAFSLASAALGIPALLGVFFTGFQLLRWFLTPVRLPSEVPASADNMLKLIDGATRIAAAPFRFLAWAGHWVIVGAAIFSMLVLLLAVLLFFTGRGLHQAQLWAKLSATMITVGLLSISVTGMAAVRRNALLLMPLCGLAACVYALWALWRRPA
jgi:hypothetical protein